MLCGFHGSTAFGDPPLGRDSPPSGASGTCRTGLTLGETLKKHSSRATQNAIGDVFLSRVFGGWHGNAPVNSEVLVLALFDSRQDL